MSETKGADAEWLREISLVCKHDGWVVAGKERLTTIADRLTALNARVQEVEGAAEAALEYMVHGLGCNLRYYNCEQKCSCGFLDAKRRLRAALNQGNNTLNSP